MPEWFISSLMMDRALDAVARRAKTLDRKHDIPYLASYSKDGKTIYIDRHMRKTLIDELNLHYLHCCVLSPSPFPHVTGWPALRDCDPA